MGDSGGMWYFEYANGEDDCGRTWIPTFLCDQTVNDFQMGTVSEIGMCRYQVEIRTKYACKDNTECSGAPQSGGGGAEESGLSTGWIFIIILITSFFAYCIVGYIVMAMTVNKEGGFKDFSNNIPQRNFWVLCPKLVCAGCGVSKEYVVGKYHQYKQRKGGDNYGQALATDDP